MSFDHKQLAQ